MLFVWLFKLTAYLPFVLFFHPRSKGKEKVPKTPCILAMNHGAALDPALINVAFPLKRIYMLTAERLFHCNRLHQWELRQMGCRPSISPSGDMETMTEIAGRLRGCEMIGFFSEGRIQSSVGSFRSGAVMLAIRTGLPLVPVYIRTAPFFRGGTRITFGEPVSITAKDIPSAQEIEAISENLRNQVIRLSDEA